MCGGHQITNLSLVDCGREQESPLQVGVQPLMNNAVIIRVAHNSLGFMAWSSGLA
jgi:hypothetical protein